MNDSILKIKRIEIQPTSSCNLNCPICRGPKRNSKEEISILFLIKFLKKMKKKYQTSQITISGGEPTMYQNFNLMISLLKKENFYLRLFTNGYFYNILKENVSEINHLVLPFDGHNLNLCKKIRGTDFSLDNTKRLLENEVLNKGKLSVGCVVNKKNINYLKEISEEIQLLSNYRKSKNLSEIKLRFFHFNPQLNSFHVKNDFYVSNEEFLSVKKEIYPKFKELITHMEAFKNESFSCFILRPNGDLDTPIEDCFVNLSNIYNENWEEILQGNLKLFNVKQIIPHL